MAQHQPESLQESQALVTLTQTAVPSRGHCTCKQPTLGLHCPPAHIAQMWAHTAWLQQLKEKMKASFPRGGSTQRKFAQQREPGLQDLSPDKASARSSS